MKSCIVFVGIFFCLMAVCSAGCGPAAPGAYGGAPASASIPAPPCPKNYLFSCQPQLRPIPCGQAAAGSYGGAGSYSDQYPIYALPPYNVKYPTEEEAD